jgi:uncharacterized membrane protein
MKGNVLTASSKVNQAIAGLVALGIASAATSAYAKAAWMKKGVKVEKCYGVAKAGMNDCAAKGHACAGKSTVDNDPDSFIFLPAGICDKLGGHVMADTPAPAPTKAGM